MLEKISKDIIIKYLRKTNLIISIIFIILFFYKYRISENGSYGLGQIFELIIRISVIFLLLISLFISIVNINKKANIYLFSTISQILKISAYLLNIIITNSLGIMFNLDFLVLIPIYSLIILINLLIIKKFNNSKNIEEQSNL